MHPSIEHLMQYFAYEHLPEHLQAVSRPYAEMADRLVFGSQDANPLPENPETAVALRKLLESKDCAVRAALSSS